MKYCPKCKAEYEDTASRCGDCKIDLVWELEQAKIYKPIIEVKKSELNELEKYLEYSKITDYKVEDVEVLTDFDPLLGGQRATELVEGAIGEDAIVNDTVRLLVPEEDYENVYKFIAVYAAANMADKDNKDEFYFDEYKTEKVDVEDKVSDLNGTVYSFGILGVGLVLFSGLSFAGVLKTPFSGNILFLIVAFLLGISSVFVAVNSKKKAQSLSVDVEKKEEKINQIFESFLSKNNVDKYLSKKDIDLSVMDEGAKYFAVFDLIKADILKDFPNEELSIINSVADKFYKKINK